MGKLLGPHSAGFLWGGGCRMETSSCSYSLVRPMETSGWGKEDGEEEKQEDM